MTSKVLIISNAFVRLGEFPINDINVTNPIHSAASIVYDRLLCKILSHYPWAFATQYQELSLFSTSPPQDEWQYAFQLPTVPFPLWIYRPYPKWIKYKIYQDKLYANTNKVAVDYIYQPTEDKFPEYFVNLMIYQLAAEISLLITKNINISTNFKTTAQREMANAMAQDGQQFTNPIIENDEIYTSHFS